MTQTPALELERLGTNPNSDISHLFGLDEFISDPQFLISRMKMIMSDLPHTEGVLCEYCKMIFLFLFFFTMLMACESSQARDQSNLHHSSDLSHSGDNAGYLPICHQGTPCWIFEDTLLKWKLRSWCKDLVLIKRSNEGGMMKPLGLFLRNGISSQTNLNLENVVIFLILGKGLLRNANFS